MAYKFSLFSFRIVLLFFCSFVFFLCFCSQAFCEFRVCNATQGIVGVAIGYRTEKGWVSEGWWHISPAHCEVVVEGPLKARFYYLHAEDSKNEGQWQGPVSMCLKDEEFHIEGVENCYVRGFQRASFAEIDTVSQTRWTLQLTDSSTSDAGKGLFGADRTLDK